MVQLRVSFHIYELLSMYKDRGVVGGSSRSEIERKGLNSKEKLFVPSTSTGKSQLDHRDVHIASLSKHKCSYAHTILNSVNIRAKRLWMLRLACDGLNLDDDANLYMNNSTPGTVLSFYSTPLADNVSKEFLL